MTVDGTLQILKFNELFNEVDTQSMHSNMENQEWTQKYNEQIAD